MPAFDYILFPGRHHLVTRFQVDYLKSLLANAEPFELSASAKVVWAVTSSTHHGTRRNPLPASRREAMIERVSTMEQLPSLVALVADIPPSEQFAHMTLATLELTLGAAFTPENTLVACSTDSVAQMYRAAGFTVARVEKSRAPSELAPWDVVELMLARDERWRALTHPGVLEFFDRYSLEKFFRLTCLDPVVSSEGDLTTTRNYGVYSASFDSASDRKWEQLLPFVQPGKIVDMGCAAGGLLERAGRVPALAESDLYGVDVSRHLIAEAEHRKAQGVFQNPNTFFIQRNLLSAPVFPKASVNTTTTVALTHEISSYGNGIADLKLLSKRIFEHTVPGGVWINSDVVGPLGGDKEVLLRLDGARRNKVDELDSLTSEEVKSRIVNMAPAERFEQFAYDFPRLSGARFEHEWVNSSTVRTSLKNVMEFLYTRDYLDNYLSECHERFCDLDFNAWRTLVEAAGFEVAPGSKAWRNQWLVDNRISKGVQVTDTNGNRVDWPDTHVLMVARRPLA